MCGKFERGLLEAAESEDDPRSAQALLRCADLLEQTSRGPSRDLIVRTLSPLVATRQLHRNGWNCLAVLKQQGLLSD